MNATAKYLDRFCDEALDRESFADLASNRYARALAIPACAEGASLDAAVASIPADSARPTLAVVVINHRVDADAAVVASNRDAAARLRASYPEGLASFGRLVIVERELPADQGVGLARKIGCDLLFRLWTSGAIASRWMHCTDADVRLPEDYFDGCDELVGSALLHPFRHEPGAQGDERNVGEDIVRYEIMLRHYVAGLHAARSPYAFHTIGSTMSVDAEAYARVRGFPCRRAGEDFYMLNKLAKVGAVAKQSGSPVRLSARVSDRVPFGTGRAMIEAGRGRPRECYDPRTFELLGLVLEQLSETPVMLRFHSAPLSRAVGAIGLLEAYGKARERYGAGAILRRRMHEWLDAFRTRKLLHALRDDGFAAAPAEEHVVNSAFLQGEPETLDPAGLLEFVRAREAGHTGPMGLVAFSQSRP